MNKLVQFESDTPVISDLKKITDECPECLMDTLWQRRDFTQFYCCFCDLWWRESRENRHVFSRGSLLMAHGSQATDSITGLIQLEHSLQMQAQQQQLSDAYQLMQLQAMRNVTPAAMIGDQNRWPEFLADAQSMHRI